MCEIYKQEVALFFQKNHITLKFNIYYLIYQNYATLAPRFI